MGFASGLFNFEAFRWTAATGMVRLGTIPDAVGERHDAVTALLAREGQSSTYEYLKEGTQPKQYSPAVRKVERSIVHPDYD